MQVMIGEIAEKAIVVTPSTKCEYIYSLFTDSSSCEGIVVCVKSEPVGLIMKTHFYQKLSTKYGFDLFMKRGIDLVMNREPLIVDVSVPLTEVSAQAMYRDQENLYDYVIVTKKDQLVGIVSIKDLLMKLAEVQISIARYSNPLTGLPGNVEIASALKNTLTFEKYSVLYIDINSFKTFNDTFGFQQGDEVIQETAALIQQSLLQAEMNDYFIGHIGGDDFIAILPDHEFEPVCQLLLESFDQMAKKFYSKEEIEQGHIPAINRQGELENVPLIGLSIAVIQNKNKVFQSIEELSREAAKLKKKCKALKRNVYLTLQDAEMNICCP